MSRIGERNKHFRQIVDEIKQETNLSETRILNAIRHFFNWQREEFSDPNYASYLWPKFGSFTYFNYPNRGKYYAAADIYRGIEPKTEQELKSDYTNGEEEDTEQDNDKG